PRHVTEVDGFPVTSVARTFFDLCGDPDPGLRQRGGHPVHEKKMARVYNDAAGRRGLSFVQEMAVLTVLARRGRRGTRLVRRLLLRFGPSYEPTRSDTESLFFELVATFGLREPEKQAVVTDIEGWIGTVDFLWRTERVIVEIDSTWHDGPLDQERDGERDERAEAAGYAVCRYRYRQLVSELHRVHRELVVAMRHMTA
ncbi:MAG: endonuclease domain-containing protein, partial [Acidimicrobiales bacterium]